MRRIKMVVRPLSILLIAIFALSLALTGCGGQSSRPEEVTPLMEDVEQTESESKEVRKARGVLEDASYAVRKFNMESSDKNYKQLIKTYNKLVQKKWEIEV